MFVFSDPEKKNPEWYHWEHVDQLTGIYANWRSFSGVPLYSCINPSIDTTMEFFIKKNLADKQNMREKKHLMFYCLCRGFICLFVCISLSAFAIYQQFLTFKYCHMIWCLVCRIEPFCKQNAEFWWKWQTKCTFVKLYQTNFLLFSYSSPNLFNRWC